MADIFYRMSFGGRASFSRIERSTTGAALVAIAVLLAPTNPARSEWESSAYAYKGWTVTALEIDGLAEPLASELRRGLGLARASGIRRTRPEFFSDLLRDDLARSSLFLARRGYPYASIEPRLLPDDRGQRLVVALRIETGPAVRVRAVVLEGVPASLVEEARDAVTIERGATFADAPVQAGRGELQALLRHEGHARSEVETKLDWVDSTGVDVRYVARPGPVYYFGNVTVTGDAPDDVVPLVKRTAAVRRGGRYSPERIDAAQTNLRVLGLFRQIHLDVVDAVGDTLDLRIEVLMRESRSVTANVRFWSDERLQLGARWEHRNLLRRGRGGSALLFTSTFLQMAEVSAWWPSLVGPRSRGIVIVGVQNEREDSFDALSYGVDTVLRNNRSLETWLGWGLSVKDVVVTEKTLDPDPIDRQSGLLTTLHFNFERLRTDQPVAPLRGTNVRFRVEWAPNDPVSEHNYVSGITAGSVYLPVRGTTNIATHLTVGLAKPTGDSIDLLANKRFYAGGATSMRGFRRRQLGPLDEAGNPLGGEAKMLAAAELRFPLFWKLRSTTFVDAGQVWPTIDLMRIDNVEVALGAGLWFTTLIGPIRGDVAYRLTDFEESQPRWVFHFSIGPAF